MTGQETTDRPRVTICGLGPGGTDQITEATSKVLSGPHRLFLRTGRHPSAEGLAGVESFDDLYERADSFDDVYTTITESIVEAAHAEGHVVYAVPGSPLILERSVRYLRAAEGIDVRLMPAVSFLDEVWARLRIDPVEASVRLIDGLSFETDAADQRGPLLVAHVHSSWVLSDIKLALDVGSEQPVTVLQRLGTPDEKIFEVEWPELDRAVEADHLTTLYIPELAVPVGRELARSVEMMSRLRRHCPWDREQTHGSLRKYLIEEAYEVLDAIDALPETEPSGHEPLERAVAAHQPAESDEDGFERFADLEEELGDLWFQILFHAELAAEAGQFTIADVARGITDKMIRRHPHVYGNPSGSSSSAAPNVAGNPSDGNQPGSSSSAAPNVAGNQPGSSSSAAPNVAGNPSDGNPSGSSSSGLPDSPDGSIPADWERLKQQEKARHSVLDGIPSSLPALALAGKVLKKAAAAGSAADLDRTRPLAAALIPEGSTPETVGTALLAVVELARVQGINAEEALRAATKRADARFRAAEAAGSTDSRWIAG